MGKVVITNLAELADSISNVAKNILSIPQFNITPSEIINYCDFNNNTRYNKLLIPKKHKRGFRTVYAPQGKLSVILKALNEILNSLYTPDKYVSGFVRNRSIADNAYNHIGQQYVLSIDLKDFFEHVKYERIVNKLIEIPYNFPIEIARVIAQLTCVVSHKDRSICLAQGSPIAPIISNIIFEDIDRAIYNYCCTKLVRYSRYADDLAFSCNQNILQISGIFMDTISSILYNEHFAINKRKTCLRNRSQRQEVTGIVVNIKPNVPRSYIKEIRNLLYIWEKYGLQEVYKSFFFHHNKKCQNQNKDVPYVINYLRGKISYLGLIRGYSDKIYINFSQKFNYLITTSKLAVFQIKLKNLNKRLLQTGVNLVSFSNCIDQFGQNRSFFNAGWYGKIYFDDKTFKRVIKNDYILAQEYFLKLLETNISFSKSGAYLYATKTVKPDDLSRELSFFMNQTPERTKDRSWRVTSHRYLTPSEIESISEIIIVPSMFGCSVKFLYKNGTIKFIPLSFNSTKGLGEYLDPKEVVIVTLTSNDETLTPIQRISNNIPSY